MFHKVLIANRGAIARRVIRACSEMGVKTVALYSDADAQAPYLAEASESYHLPGNKAVDTYLNQDAVLAAMQHCGVDGVHPGYGFLSEHVGFAQRVADAGSTFIGPATQWLEAMGDKVAARETMAGQGFPTFGGSEALRDFEHARALAQEIGYPLMLKPSGGGGGMGMQRVDSVQDLETALHQARAIAGQAFGNSAVYLERYLSRPRHIEYQILASNDGRVMHAYERECSVQRRHQKLIEESPAPNLDPQQLLSTAGQAVQALTKLGYNNVGTVETLVDQTGATGFLEMNTRIQVEHGVTEMVTGLDLVQSQIRLAAGGDLPEQPGREGVAIQARLYAEDSITMMPSTGTLSRFRIPELFGVRVETGFGEGHTVSPYYDALLAKVIAHAHTRELAIGRLVVALKAIEVSGVKTNAALLIRLLESEDFRSGDIDTDIVNRVNR
ncbi:MAG: biotin carboxylase N-terminal domain-containing protein [Pseudomonadota bacterium]